MSFLSIGPIIFGSTGDLVDYLRGKHLLAAAATCSKCSIPMEERDRMDVSDKITWRCQQCKTMKTIREGSFFSKSRITLQKWLLLIFFWSREYPVMDAAKDSEVTHTTAINVYQWLREVCSTTFINGPQFYLVDQVRLYKLMSLSSDINQR